MTKSISTTLKFAFLTLVLFFTCGVSLKAQPFQNFYHVLDQPPADWEGGRFSQITELLGNRLAAVGTTVPGSGVSEATVGIFGSDGSPLKFGKIGKPGASFSGLGVCATSDGGAALAIQGRDTCYVVKLNSGYGIQWVRSYPGINAVKIAGGLTSANSEIHLLANYPPNSVVTASFDLAGNLIASTDYNPLLLNNQVARDLIYDPVLDQIAILTGIAPFPPGNPSSYDIRLIITNPLGAIITDNQYSLPDGIIEGVEFAHSTKVGSYVITGNVNLGDQVPFAFETNLTGFVSWAYTYNSSVFFPRTNGTSIVQNGAREYVMAVASGFADNQSYLLKLDELGLPVDLRSYNGTVYQSTNNRIDDIEFFSGLNTGLLCAGYYETPSFVPGYPPFAYWLMHLEHTTDGLCFEGHDVKAEKLILQSDSLNLQMFPFVNPDNPSLTMPSYQAETHLQCGFQKGHVEALDKHKEVLVSPNPTSDLFSIDLGEWTIEEVVVYDDQGRLVLQKHVSDQHQFDLEVSAWAEGIYTLRLIGKDQEVSKRISVVR